MATRQADVVDYRQTDEVVAECVISVLTRILREVAQHAVVMIRDADATAGIDKPLTRILNHVDLGLFSIQTALAGIDPAP